MARLKMTVLAPLKLTCRIEDSLMKVFDGLEVPGAPPLLGQAMRHAVFPGGARMRPRLLLSVARACGDRHPEAANGAAASLELLHCASLVHDDLPAFDDALIRRGRASVHKAFGEAMAILAGDALIVLAFETLGAYTRVTPQLLPDLLRVLGRGVGATAGIVAGQAWESEPQVDLRAYHQAKTGALFEAAVVTGAITGGGDPEAWLSLGRAFGEAYQVADDIADVLNGGGAHLGKPTGRDAALGRPNVALELGVTAAAEHLASLLRTAMETIQPCQERKALQLWIARSVDHFLPKSLGAPMREQLLEAVQGSR